jgi:hypothetical protein
MAQSDKNIINASGFPFQIKVKKVIEDLDQTNWKVESVEHRWDFQEQIGFIDLIAGQYDTQRLIIECKRDRKPWYFIVNKHKEMKDLKCLFRYNSEGSYQYLWWQFLLSPLSYKSEFSVVEGQGVKGQPMLERICDDLLLSTEAIMHQEASAEIRGSRKWYFPIIVTNAPIYACLVDSQNIDVKTGDLEKFEKVEVPLIRFEKPLLSSIKSSNDFNSFYDINEDTKRTVLVINASHLEQILNDWDIRFKEFNDPPGFRR